MQRVFSALARGTYELRNEVVEELISRLEGGSCTERDGVLRSGSRSRGMESEKGRRFGETLDVVLRAVRQMIKPELVLA